MLGYCGGIEEESCTGLRLVEEVGRERGDTVEEGETGAGFEHEESDGLLDEQANDDSGPGR